MFEPQFDSLRDLIWMDGHGPYVWACYGLAFLATVYLVWSPLAGQRRFLRQLRATLRREQRVSNRPGAVADSIDNVR